MTIRVRDDDDDGVLAVFCDACGERSQSVPGDDEREWRESFLRQIGWRAEEEGRHSCPFCAGGENLERLRRVFEGKTRLS